MRVSPKDRDFIADQLPRLMFDTFGWEPINEAEEDALEELAHHVAMGIRALIDDREVEL